MKWADIYLAILVAAIATAAMAAVLVIPTPTEVTHDRIHDRTAR
jgi:hypothetical protein